MYRPHSLNEGHVSLPCLTQVLCRLGMGHVLVPYLTQILCRLGTRKSILLMDPDSGTAHKGVVPRLK